MHSSRPDRSAAEHAPQDKNSKPEAADAKAAATAHRKGKHSARSPLSRKTLLLRKLRRFVWWLLLLPLLAAAALWYWSHSAQSLRQALELAQQHVPGLHFDGVSGSLWGGGQIRNLHWSDGNTRVHANDVSVHWDVMQLQKNRTLAISRLHAESLTIRSRADDSQAEPQPITLPEALTLPLSVAAEDLNIQQLLVYIDDIDNAAQPVAAQQQTPEQTEKKPPAVTLTDVRGSYHYSASQQQHNASISHAATRQDAVIVRAAVPQLTLSATAPFALTARLEADAAMYSSDTAAMSASAGKSTAPEPAAEIALELGITASGELENPQLRIDARERQAQNATQPPFTLQGTASLLPLTPAALQRAELQLLHFNPARFDDSAPRASLDTRLTVQPVLDSDKPELVQAWQVQLASHNRHSGTFENQLLPLEQLHATLHWQPQQPARLTADNINIQWPQGSTTGKAHLDWSNADRLQWGGALQLHDINPQLLAADAPPANISGTLHFHPPEPQQHDSLLHVQLELHNSTAGSWDSNRLPLSHINTLLTLHSQSLTLQNIQAQTGGGSVSGNFSTRISAPYTWQGKLDVNGINPHELHSAAAPARLQGELRVGNADDLHSAGITDRPHTERPHSNATTDDDTIHFAVNLTGKLLESPRQQQASVGNSNLSTLPGLPFDKLVLSGSVGTGAQQNIALHHIDIAAMNAIVTGKARINPQTLAFNTDGLRIQTPGLDARLNGAISPSDGKGSLAIRLDNASNFQSWLDSIFRAQTPAWIQPLQQGKLSGSASLEADWTGGWENPTLQAKLNSPRLSMLPTAAAEPTAETPEKAKTAKQKPSSAAPIWQTEKTHVQIQGTLQNANISGSSNIQLGSSNATLKLKANAGYNIANGRTRATIDTLSATMKTAAAASQASKARTGSTTSAGNIPSQWQARLTRTVQLQWQDKQLHIGSGSATVSTAGTGAGSETALPATASIHWQDSHWSQAAESALGDIRTSGHLTGLPLRWIELVRPGTLDLAGVDTSLVFDGKWDMHTRPALRFSAQLQRSSGDVHMLFADQLAAEISGETHHPALASATAGVKAAQLRLHNQGDQLHLSADWDSSNAGNMQLHLQSSLQQTADGWSWGEQTPISGTLKMQLPQVGIWSSLAPVGWRISGGISAQADISGNRSQPQIQGRFSSENIRIYSLTDGLELENGSLKGRFDSSQFALDTLTFSSEGGGTLTGSGKAEWAGAQQQKKGFQISFQAEADSLQISNRPDRRLSFSGTLRANGNTEKITIKGNAAIDQAQIILADEAAPALSDDVTVIYPEKAGKQTGISLPGSEGARSRAQQKAERKQRRKAQQQARKAGQQQSIQLQAAIDLDLGNSFRLQGMGLDTFLSGKLSITSDGDAPRVHGTISTRMGEFRAYGQWLEIEKGKIRFSGKYDNPSLDITALRPRTEVDVGVQVSGPAFNPKIRLISTPDMPDTEKLSWLILGREGAEGGAESALLQQAAIALIGGGGTGKSVAQRVGLDEIGINRENGETSSVSFGKRLSRKLYLSYETSLLDSVSTLYLFYDISRRFKIRAQTGNEQAVDLIFTLRYDDLPDAMRQLRGKPADNPRAATPTAAKPQ